MHEFEQLTSAVAAGENLSNDHAAEAARYLTQPAVPDEAKERFLRALAEKGESATEVAAFAAVFRSLAVDPGVDAFAARAIDVCGTGGDGSGTFNISTAVSFLVAAGGVPVFKHGNRSITSSCGSADMMEALGIRLEVPVETHARALEALDFCFFFAPAFHPAFKEIMPVRRSMAAQGQRSIFNLLGPLINPGRPAHQLLGVFAATWVAPLASALGALGLRSGIVAHGTPRADLALDELSCAGTNLFQGFGTLAGEGGALDPARAGLESCDFEALKGGGVEANLQTMVALLEGGIDAVPRGLRDTVALNAGAAFWVVGRAADIRSGAAIADELLRRGDAARWLERARRFYEQV